MNESEGGWNNISNPISATTNAGSSEDTLSSAENLGPKRGSYIKHTKANEDSYDLPLERKRPGQPPISDKAYVAAFQERIGYGELQRSNSQKWACKNCLLGFVRELLGPSSNNTD